MGTTYARTTSTTSRSWRYYNTVVRLGKRCVACCGARRLLFAEISHLARVRDRQFQRVQYHSRNPVTNSPKKL